MYEAIDRTPAEVLRECEARRLHNFKHAGVPPARRGYFQHLLTTVMKLHEDGASTGDL